MLTKSPSPSSRTVNFLPRSATDFSNSTNDGERAWSLCESGNCAHSLAHVHFEDGALDEGAAFINDWQLLHGDTSDMRHHLL